MPVSGLEIDAGSVIPHPDLVNIYGCAIGPGTQIGAFVEIQARARIGSRCRIGAAAFVCEGVTLEDDVTVGAGVMFTNDLHPRAATASGELAGPSDWILSPTFVRAGVWIGANATILGGTTIGAGARIECGSVVTRDVAPGATVSGAPARIVHPPARRSAPALPSHCINASKEQTP